MDKILDIIEKHQFMTENLPSLIWLTSQRNRGEGRTLGLAIAFIINAMRFPGEPVEYFDHSEGHRRDGKDRMRQTIESLNDKIVVDRNQVVSHAVSTSNLYPKFLIPSSKVAPVIFDLVKTLAVIAYKNNIEHEELAEILREEMVKLVMNG